MLTSTPSPSGLPLSQREKVDASAPHPLCPSKLWGEEGFRRMTECHSVPSEGSTTQCDAGQSEAEGVCQVSTLRFNPTSSSFP